VKVIVTHHPFDLPAGHDEDDLVGRARMAVEALAACCVDLFLAGHLHISHTGHTAERYRLGGRSALVAQAGTATSTRGRGEANSFNVIRLTQAQITIERLVWDPTHGSFVASLTERFHRSQTGWSAVRPEEAGDD